MVLTRGETRRLLGSVRSGRFRAVLALIYHCGLRVGEAVALKPSHIDAQRGVVRIVEGTGGRNARGASRYRHGAVGCAAIGGSIATSGGSFRVSDAAGRIALVRSLAQWESPAKP